MTVLAWVPILDPIDLGQWWWTTIVPLVALISLSYKAMRVSRPRDILPQTISMSAQLLGCLVILAAVLMLISVWVFPWWTEALSGR